MVTSNGIHVWWDSTQGSFCADGLIGGLGQYSTVDAIASAAGLTLSAEDRSALQAEYDNRPADDSYSAAARISKASFMDRFTEPELVAIYTAAQQSVQIVIWLDRFRVAEFMNLADPRTIGGVNALESAGLIGPGRAAQILKVS